MKRARRFLAAACGAVSSLVWAGGCLDGENSCHDYNRCDDDRADGGSGAAGASGGAGTAGASGGAGTAGATGSAGTSGGAGGGAGSDGGGAGGSIAPDGGGDAADARVCDRSKRPSEDACVIDEKYGIFVAPSGSDASGGGTRGAPFKTLGRALVEARNAGRRVYACAGTYSEAVTIDAVTDGAEVFGGLDCATWSYAANRRPSVKPAAGVPLTVKNLAIGFTIEDFELEAPPTSSKGESSVAVFVASSSNVKLVRSRLVAKDAQAGADGAAPVSNYDVALMQDNPKLAGRDASNALGGPQQTCAMLCANNVRSTGGKGGNGAVGADAGAPSSGENGAPAIDPATPPTATGKGGDPQLDSNGSCASGARGSNAISGGGGIGAAKAGTLTTAGWVPADGATGSAGAPGQGGGGGGGGISPTKGGGGGGGCGGCGGAGAPGGVGGGSSFALLSFQSAVILDACVLVAARGGDGGKGAEGQAGQLGGFGGVQSAPGCQGGVGGQGGLGGGGGGGAGGLSVGVAYAGTAPSQINGSIEVAVQPAAGGAGGTPNATGGKSGVAQAALDLAL